MNFDQAVEQRARELREQEKAAEARMSGELDAHDRITGAASGTTPPAPPTPIDAIEAIPLDLPDEEYDRQMMDVLRKAGMPIRQDIVAGRPEDWGGVVMENQ